MYFPKASLFHKIELVMKESCYDNSLQKRNRIVNRIEEIKYTNT